MSYFRASPRIYVRHVSGAWVGEITEGRHKSASSPRRIESDRAAEVARERAGRGGVGVLRDALNIVGLRGASCSIASSIDSTLQWIVKEPTLLR